MTWSSLSLSLSLSRQSFPLVSVSLSIIFSFFFYFCFDETPQVCRRRLFFHFIFALFSSLERQPPCYTRVRRRAHASRGCLVSLRESDSRTDQDASGRKEGNEAKFFFKKLIHCIIHHKYILSFAREREREGGV